MRGERERTVRERENVENFDFPRIFTTCRGKTKRSRVRRDILFEGILFFFVLCVWGPNGGLGDGRENF